MGTQVEMIAYASAGTDVEAAFSAAFARIDRLEELLSDYDPDSEISRLSAASPTPAPVPVSDELHLVLSVSRTVSQQSGGAFDVTVGPLTSLWRRARREKKLPTAAAIEAARQAVGFDALVVHSPEKKLELRRPGMRLDLGGIAKGYACDEAVRVLREHGLTRTLVNAGGDIVCGDAPPQEPGWIVGIAPLQADQPPSEGVVLCNSSVATSGDLWQFVEVDGVRYSHLIDPHTGLGLTVRSSVTVVAPNGMLADAYASALSVLPPQRGLELLVTLPDIHTRIVRLEADQARTYQSPGFVTQRLIVTNDKAR